MKKIILILFITFFNINTIVFCQTKKNEKVNVVELNIAQEKIFIHQNTSFLLTGENLLYTVYCLNSKTNKRSDFSKIAYVELVAKDLSLIFRQKIKLQNGIGQGDYFIPTSVKSGNYKLIAYTQWMRNGKIENYYQNDISIINPFQENQNEISEEKNNLTNSFADTLSNNFHYKNKNSNNLISLELKTNTFLPREKVVLNIKKLNDNLSKENYSISVRKIDSLKIPYRQTASYFRYSSQMDNTTIETNKSLAFLPEIRGEIYQGKVLFKDTKNPVNNIKVALSFPGKNSIFKIANTNSFGKYYFNVAKAYESDFASIQIINDHPEKYDLILQPPTLNDYKDLKFYNFKITPEAKSLILNYSINNQIENAYASIKPDDIKEPSPSTPFFNNEAKEYLLDDYTRFKSIKETFVEIIPEVYTTQRKDNFSFHVRVYASEIESGLLPLVLIDGNLIQDQNELKKMNTNKIEKISIVNKMYIYGSQIFEGIISISTFDGLYKSTSAYQKHIKLTKPLPIKKYFNPIYTNSNKLNRIPDYRRQLLWLPNYQMDKKIKTISFYTSDVKGAFEICLEGITTSGKAVSIKKIIYVK